MQELGQARPGDARFVNQLDAELAGRVAWMVRLRWFAGGAVISLTGVAALIPRIVLPWLPILFCGLLIIAYNTIFAAILRRFKSRPKTKAQRYLRLASAQFITDWAVLTVLVHLTGGLGSPVLFFFVFHAILASILLPPGPAWLHASAGVLLVVLMAGLEYSGVLPHRSVQGFLSVPADDPVIVAGMLTFFASAIAVTILLTGTIANRLWTRTRELSWTAARLEDAFIQTRTINEIGRAVSSSLDIDEVLHRILDAAAGSMGADAGCIRLVDQDTGMWWTRAATGMPESFLQAQDAVSPLQGPFNRKLMAGETVVVSDVAGTTGCLLPDATREAGLRAMLAVPLRSSGSTIGIINVYSHAAREFTDHDKDFLTALANQVVAAVDSARAYRHLQALNQAKTRFFFTAAHELKSPVAAVQSSLDLLMEGYLGGLPENQKNVLERTHIRLDGLRSLLADLMDMGSIGNPSPADMAAVDFGALTTRMTEVMRLDADSRDIGLAVSVESTHTVKASERHLERLVENLVGNAIKYTPEGGRVAVGVRDDEGHVLFTVADSGVGIGPDALPHIFEEFYRAEGVRHSHEGTGLGLALVKKICDTYDAKIDVESQPGAGTTFTVSIPAVSRPDR